MCGYPQVLTNLKYHCMWSLFIRVYTATSVEEGERPIQHPLPFTLCLSLLLSLSPQVTHSLALLPRHSLCVCLNLSLSLSYSLSLSLSHSISLTNCLSLYFSISFSHSEDVVIFVENFHSKLFSSVLRVERRDFH